MAKKEEQTELKGTTQGAQKKEPPKEAAPKEAKKEKKPEWKGEEKEPVKKERKGAPREGKKEPAKPREEGTEEIKHIVRIADTDLDGNRSVMYALTGIKGINRRIAKAMAVDSGLDPIKTLGYLSDAEIEKLQSSVDNIAGVIPPWMMNKQNDFMSGEDRHVIGTDVYLSLNEDINFMKKIRSYKGVRHERGLRVRGQRTRSTGRKGRTVGVTRTALAASKAAEKKGEGK